MQSNAIIRIPKKLPITCNISVDLSFEMLMAGIDPDTCTMADFNSWATNHLKEYTTRVVAPVFFTCEGRPVDIIKNFSTEILEFFTKGRPVRINYRIVLNQVRGTAKTRIGMNDETFGNKVVSILASNILASVLSNDRQTEFFSNTIYGMYKTPTVMDLRGTKVTCISERPDELNPPKVESFMLEGEFDMSPTMPSTVYNRMKECRDADCDQLTKRIRTDKAKKICMAYSGYGYGWERWPDGGSWVSYVRMYLHCPELFDIDWNKDDGLFIVSKKAFRDEREILGDIISSIPGVRVTGGEEVQTFLPVALHPFNPDYKYPFGEEVTSGKYGNQNPEYIIDLSQTEMGNKFTITYKREIYDPLKAFNEFGELERLATDIANHFKWMKEGAKKLIDAKKSLVQNGKEELAEIVKRDPIKFASSEKYGKISELANLYLNSTDEDLEDET